MIARSVVPTGRSWEWNQALIEFGATHCTARKPACVVCPLQQACRAFPLIQTVIAQLPPGVRAKNEAPYRGSNRYYRGRILQELRGLDGAPVSLAELGRRIRPDYTSGNSEWLRGLVRDLQRDGLARVAEEPAAYDVDQPPDVSVSLP